MFPVDIFPVHHCYSNPFHHLGRPTSHMSPSHIYSTAISIPVAPHLRQQYLPLLYSPLTLSAISIILHLHCSSIVILPGLWCGTYHIIFNWYVYFAAVVFLPSLIGSSPCSSSFYTTLFDMLCSTLLFSLSLLIFSPNFSFLFCHGSFLSP